jgi:hypothetical protein
VRASSTSLVTAVEDAAAMDDAETRIDLHTALRLRTELDAVIGKLGRFNPAAVARPVLLAKVPVQPERRCRMSALDRLRDPHSDRPSSASSTPRTTHPLEQLAVFLSEERRA